MLAQQLNDVISILGDNEKLLLQELSELSNNQYHSWFRPVSIVALERKIKAYRYTFTCNIARLVTQDYIVLKKGTIRLTEKGLKVIKG